MAPPPALGPRRTLGCAERRGGGSLRIAPDQIGRRVPRHSRGVHGGSTVDGDCWDQMAVAILSPHLDDAVLSCWHVLTQPGVVVVVNVFAGVPASLDGPAWWDRYTGATDSLERVRERIDED